MGALLASNLSHDRHQCDRTNVGALSTHVAASDNLEARLLGSIDVIRDELGLHDLLFDRMTSSLDAKCVGKLRLSYLSVSKWL